MESRSRWTVRGEFWKTIHGHSCRRFCRTDEATNSLFGGISQGAESTGGYMSMAPIPSMSDVSALAFNNTSPSAVEYGYKVLTK